MRPRPNLSAGELRAAPGAGVVIPFVIFTAIWGSTWIVIRGQLGVVPPQWSVAYRFVIAGVAMSALALWKGHSLRFGPKALLAAAFLGFTQFCINFNAVYLAERHITSGVVATVFALLLIPAYYHARRMMVRYTLTDSKLEIDEGFISQTTRNIPLRNIQDVTVSATIPQRLLGFGDIIIDNASEVGGSTQMRNVPDPRRHADLLLRELRRWN